jgi:ERCC4-related helicase
VETIKPTEVYVDGSTELIPRSFQRTVFEQATKRNVIAVLETGSGKTFIATMLIKHMAQLEGNRQGPVGLFCLIFL